MCTRGLGGLVDVARHVTFLRKKAIFEMKVVRGVKF